MNCNRVFLKSCMCVYEKVMNDLTNTISIKLQYIRQLNIGHRVKNDRADSHDAMNYDMAWRPTKYVYTLFIIYYLFSFGQTFYTILHSFTRRRKGSPQQLTLTKPVQGSQDRPGTDRTQKTRVQNFHPLQLARYCIQIVSLYCSRFPRKHLHQRYISNVI